MGRYTLLCVSIENKFNFVLCQNFLITSSTLILKCQSVLHYNVCCVLPWMWNFTMRWEHNSKTWERGNYKLTAAMIINSNKGDVGYIPAAFAALILLSSMKSVTIWTWWTGIRSGDFKVNHMYWIVYLLWVYSLQPSVKEEQQPWFMEWCWRSHWYEHIWTVAFRKNYPVIS